MPAPVLPTGVLQAQAIYQTGRRTCFATLYYELDVPPTLQWHMQGIADAICNSMRDEWFACLGLGCTFTGFMCRYNGAGDVFFEAMSSQEEMYHSGGSGDDLVDTTLLPDEVTAVIRKLTGRAGREDRGRIFLSGIKEDFNDEGKVNGLGWAVLRELGAKIPRDVTATVTEPLDEGSVEEPATFTSYLHARHWNRKENVMRPIIGHLVNQVLMSRRDRRAPLVSIPFPGYVGA